MPSAVPEHSVWQEQQAPCPSAWVAVRMTPASPFEQTVTRMPPSPPAKLQQHHQHQQHHLQQQHLQPQAVAKPRRSRLVALLNCACCGSGPSVEDSTGVEAVSVGSLNSHEADVTGTVAERDASSKAQLPVSRRLSGHKTWDAVPGRHSQNLSRADTQYYDAESVYSGGDDDHHLARINSAEELDAVASQLQDQLQQRTSAGVPGVSGAAQRLVNSAGRAPWAPDTPLLFAPDNLSFVPVPAHTAFAAYWENDMVRTTPFPQPIDVMLGLNFLVKRMHKSIPGLWLQESDTVMTVTAKPSFLPPGALATYMEVFDKTNATEPVWGMRRDMGFGSMSGRIYMTSEGMLILRTVSRSLVSSKVEAICEDYLTLEDNGGVVVDRMCCLHVPSGKRAVQYQVGKRREHPPSGWGAPMVPGFKAQRTLTIGHGQ